MTEPQKAFLKNNNLIIFSASAGGEEVHRLLKELRINPHAFCDNGKQKHGTVFCGLRVISPEELLKVYNENGAVVIIASRSYHDAIHAQLLSLGIHDEHILSYSLVKELTPVIYTDGQLAELQKVMLEMLIVVHDICERHNIGYYMCFGTLLGAVRHKGFIPWDDDIDLYMFRKDYDRFFKICENELPDGFGVRRDYEGDAGLHSIYKKGTVKFPVWYRHNSRINNFGILIDIFPLDNIKTKSGLLQRFQDTADIVLLTAYRKKIKIRYPIYRLYPLSVLFSLLPAKAILWLREKATTVLNGLKTEYVFYFFGTPNLIGPRTYKREYFDEKALLDFEGRKFWAPGQYGKLLAQTYGDNYMELPPEDERTRHSTLKLSF